MMKGKRTGLSKKELYETILGYGDFVDESTEELKLKDFLDDYKDSFKGQEEKIYNNIINFFEGLKTKPELFHLANMTTTVNMLKCGKGHFMDENGSVIKLSLTKEVRKR